ncbi:MAG: dihydrofolate reductase [Dokdonella sp.]
MPWHLPDDLKHFKQLTLGKAVLMGRKTAVSIGRPLPGRKNLVMSRSGSAPYAGQISVDSIEAAVDHAAGDDLIVIGGGEIYALAMPRAERMHLTWIDAEAELADTHFPRFDPAQWAIVAEQAHAVDDRHAYSFRFVDYVLKQQT